MYCGKCGNKIDDDAAFCPHCGNSQSTEHNDSNKNKGKNTRIIIGIIGIVFAVLSVGAIWSIYGKSVFVSRSYKETAYSFMDSIYNNDMDTFIDLFSDKQISDMMETLGVYDKEQLAIELEYELADSLVQFRQEYGDCTINQNIIYEYNYTDTEIENKINDIEWNSVGYTKSDIKQMKRLKIEAEFIIQPIDYSESLVYSLDLAYDGKKWYIINMDFSDL